MNCKLFSVIDEIETDVLFIRLPNGYHINEKVVSEFYGRLLRLYRFPGLEESPISSVYAAMLAENNQYSYFVDTNSFDSFKLNDMHGVSFNEKTAALAGWEKRVLEKNELIKKGKIGFLKKEGFNFNYNFYAKRLNWQSFLPIYLLNADKSRIAGFLMIVSSEKNIFAGIDKAFEQELIKSLMSSVFDNGQQRAFDPEVFLDDIDLSKIYQLKKFNYMTIGTIVGGLLTPLTFFAGVHAEFFSIISYVLGAMALAMGVLSIPFSIKNEKLELAEKERQIIEERVLKTKVDTKYNLFESMQQSDANFLISEYVRTDLYKIKNNISESFDSYLLEKNDLQQKAFAKQVKKFIKNFKPLSQTDRNLTILYNYLESRKHLNFSRDKLFYRCALRVFLEKNAALLKKELQKKKIADDQLILHDYITIVNEIYFKHNLAFNALTYEIKELSYEILTRELNFKELTLPIIDFDSFWQSIKNYSDLNCLKALKLKLQVLSKNKFRKEKLIIAILKKQLLATSDEAAQIVLNKVKDDIESNFLYYGIFEKRYQDNMLPPFDNKKKIFEDIKKHLDFETKIIAANARILLENIDLFFSGERELYFKKLKKEHKIKFYNILIQFLEENYCLKTKCFKLFVNQDIAALTISLYGL